MSATDPNHASSGSESRRVWRERLERWFGIRTVALLRRGRNALRRAGPALHASVRRRIDDWAARRRFDASIRPTDVFLVCFPRSGAFWLQSVFAALRLARARGACGSFRHEQVEDQVPALDTTHYAHQPLDRFDALPDPRLFKVHAPADPSFPRVIFLVRDPRDAVLSLYQLRRAFDRGFASTLEDLALTYEVWPGLHWSAYVGRWLDLAERRGHLVLTYEEMHADPPRHCRRALAYAGLAASDTEIDAAIAEAWQECRRRRAGLHDGVVACHGPDVRDIRTDGVGSWRREFDVELNRRFCEQHRECMERLGYLPDPA